MRERKEGAPCGEKSKGMLTFIGGHMSHLVLRPNRMLIVCVTRNQVYTHTVKKINTE
jgi:hypothetical protein